MLEIAIVSLLGLGIIVSIIFIFLRQRFLQEKVGHPLIQTNYIDISSIQRAIENLPNKILQSFQGSINSQKGTLGELIGYIKLQAQYDRLIPMNSITDFVGIRFPKGEDLGIITFIDIKTGKNARLSGDQRMFKKLIEDKRIEFAKITITADPLDEDKSTGN